MKKQRIIIGPAITRENSLYPLSAEILNNTHDNYPCVNKIAEQITQADIYNIAVTGPYGSGKTSVLKTLEKEHPEHNYLNITLAKFDGKDNTPPIPKKSKGTESDNRADEEKLNWLLEYSIMQQLIYHEKYTTIPQSRFKRIKNLSKRFILKSAASVILFFICLAILFEPAFLKATSLYEVLKVGGTFKIVIDAVCAITIIGLLFLLVTNLIKVFGNSRLNKINLKDGEIGFCDDDTNSILNKHLDEILYYFEVTNYNVVIIEDLDRFETPVIFAKLREINTLINYYRPIHDDPNRKIVFIYAVKDDTFTDNTLRSKFFDVIIPVIPVINPSNAGSKLKQLLSAKTADADKIPDITFRDIGLFIDDMRVLKSIVDDYLQYRPILDSRLEPEKLLAMMTYKNFYPRDFAELPKRKGLLYSVLNNKMVFSVKLMDAIDKQIAVYLKEISDIEDQKYENLKELKDLYLLRFLLKHPDFRYFKDTTNNTTITLDNVYSDDHFNNLITGAIDSYIDSYSRNNKFQTPFSTISKEVDSDKSYSEKADLWNKKQSNEIHRLMQKINELKGDKLRTPYKPIKDLFADEIDGDINDFIHQNNKDSLDVRLLEFLLRRGLVDEYYEDYTSLFHEGVLTQAERDFLINVRLKKDTDCNHKMHKCEALLHELSSSPSDFKESYIFNVSLLTHICQNISKYPEEFNGILEQIKRGNQTAIEFFDCFMNSSEAVGSFLQHSIPLWEDIWLFIEDHFKDKKDNYAFLFALHLKSTELEKVDKDNLLSFFLDNSLHLLGVWETNINLNNLFTLCDTLNLRFTELNKEMVSKKLMKYIIDRNLYHITTKNIKEIFHSLEKTALDEEFDKANYTTILSSGVKSLIGYITDNMELYYDQVLLHERNSIYESEKSMTALINDESVSYDKKRSYLSRQTNWITAINNISENFWILSVESLSLYPSWRNIISFCAHINNTPQEALPISLKKYLANSSVYNILKDDEAEITEENQSHVAFLFNQIVSDDAYSFEAYSNILSGLQGIEMASVDFSDLSRDKIEYLIPRHFIPFKEYHLDIIRNSYPDLAISLFIANKDTFLEQAGNYIFNASEYKDILRSTEFNEREKVSVIEYISIEELNNDRELATLVCRIISNQTYSIEDALLFELLKLSEDMGVKFTIVKAYLINNEFDKNKTIHLLNYLEKDYRKLTIRNKRPRISVAGDMELLNYLKKNGFIKNIIPHDGYIKIINRD